MKQGMGVKQRKRRGKGFFDDLASGLIHVGIPTLGRIAGTVIGGPAGAMVGETLGEAGADAIGRATGRGLKNKTHTLYSPLVDGIPSLAKMVASLPTSLSYLTLPTKNCGHVGGKPLR